MRILHVNATSGGGAFRAMERLHRGLSQASIESFCLIQNGGSMHGMLTGLGRFGRRLLPALDSFPLHLYRGRRHEAFNLQWVPSGLLRHVRELNPDIVHLHWAHRTSLRIEELPLLKRPIVWTMHDLWTFTGGCHYPFDCDRYRTGCGRCPVLGSNSNIDLSRWVLKRKMAAWKDLPITLISPSRWLKECAATSPLTRGKRLLSIPNGLDLDIFKPFTRESARQLLGLEPDRPVMLFGAMHVNAAGKGFYLLGPAVKAAARRLAPVIPQLLVLGADVPADSLDLGLPVRLLGQLHDDVSLRLAYCAADVTIVPSTQDNLPQMAVESLACGTPVAAFNCSGLRDVVDHGVNGLLANPFEPEALGACIAEILFCPDPKPMRDAARLKAETEFSVKIMIERYAEIYKQLV
ncbi:MAG: hypothetical protein FD177_2220 [Desulfovibrionaceae bacterium]|nr:MAG: hypothetical protein FD177_2220 [Desulfovibrionaceae bacterium]